MPNFTPTTLHTERLALRWLTMDDLAAQYALFSDTSVTRYWSTEPWTDLEQARAYLAAALADYASGESVRFAITLRAGGEMIGSCRLYGFHDTNRRCDIGYALMSGRWGKGYVTEALTALLGHAFNDLNMNRIEADIDPRNEASGRVLEKLAFVREGTMRERWIVGGEVCDTAFYGLLRRDWEAR